MHYLVQLGSFNDPRYDQIFSALEELKLSYETIEFKPNSSEFDYQTKRKDVFVYGSVKLAKISATMDWTPGSFYGGNHEFEHYGAGYGEHTVNFGSKIYTVSDELDWSSQEKYFIKPSQDAKVFTGKVFRKAEWEDFVYENLNDPKNLRFTHQTKIQVGMPFRFIKEARVWIVGGKVITSSYYLFHGNVAFEENVAEDGLAFAKEMSQLFNVADAYVMDVGLTDSGWKIVEVNCINCAGLYKGDIRKILLALEDFYA